MDKKIVPVTLLLAWSAVVFFNLSAVRGPWSPGDVLAFALALGPVVYAVYRWGRRRRKALVVAGTVCVLGLLTSTPAVVADSSCQYFFAIVGFWCFPPAFGWGIWLATCFPIFGYVPTGDCAPQMLQVRPL